LIFADQLTRNIRGKVWYVIKIIVLMAGSWTHFGYRPLFLDDYISMLGNAFEKYTRTASFYLFYLKDLTLSYMDFDKPPNWTRCFLLIFLCLMIRTILRNEMVGILDTVVLMTFWWFFMALLNVFFLNLF